eukprot:scaffold85767_cov63-Phaeocystis_antarctica.AAC.3
MARALPARTKASSARHSACRAALPPSPPHVAGKCTSIKSTYVSRSAARLASSAAAAVLSLSPPGILEVTK